MPEELLGRIERMRTLFLKIMPQIQAKFLVPKQMLFESHMTLSELKTLSLFRDIEHYRMSDLAAAAFMPLPTMTHVTDKLVKRGLLKRGLDQKDRRIIIVEITKKGRGILDEHRKAHTEGVKKFLELIDAEDQAKLMDAIDRFADAMESINKKMLKNTEQGRRVEK
jgi:DNA-binding MarR family transcriptional regulator